MRCDKRGQEVDGRALKEFDAYYRFFVAPPCFIWDAMLNGRSNLGTN